MDVKYCFYACLIVSLVMRLNAQVGAQFRGESVTTVSTWRRLFMTMRGGSSVLFAYLFLLLFGQIVYIYKVEQDSLYFFPEGGFKGIYLRERHFTLLFLVSDI